MRAFLLLFVFSLLFSYESKSQNENAEAPLRLDEVQIIARDILQSAKWYVKNLNFKVKKSKLKEYAIIENGDFTLHIITAKRTITAKQVNMPPNKERINGFYELGFLCSDLDSLMYQYEGREIRKLKDLGFDLEYGTNTVVLADPDGNRVKLFQAKEEIPGFNFFKANFISITTSDIETGVRWYKKNLGFKELTNNYSERARISYCLLKNGDFSIELQELSGRTMEITELLSDQIELTRYNVVTLKSGNTGELLSIMDNDGNKLKL